MKNRNNYRVKSQTNKEIKIGEYACPFCNEKMKLASNFEVYGDGEQYKKKFLLCPGCGSYCQIRKSNTKRYYLVSTPATRETKNLRNEAHWYFNYVIENKLVANKTDAYIWLSNQFGKTVTYLDEMIHIGEMDNEQCISTIKYCIDKLYENKDHIRYYARFYKTFGEGITGFTENNMEYRNKLIEIKKAHDERRARKVNINE